MNENTYGFKNQIEKDILWLIVEVNYTLEVN